jgi:gliding motility-associated-like protein
MVILPNTTIYVRVQNSTDPTCFSISSFTVSILPVPAVDVLEPVVVCDFYELQPLTNGNYFTQTNGQGTMLSAGDIIVETTTLYIFNQPNGPGTCAANSVFRITIVDPNTLSPNSVTSCGSYTLPQPQYGKYFSQPGGQGVEIPAGTVINSTQTVYFYFTTDIEPFCIVDTDFTVTIIPSVEVGTRNDIFECTSYTLPELSVGNYFTQPGGNGTQMAAGTVITSNQTVYVYATTGGTSPCTDEDSFEVFIGINQPADISQCNGYTLPNLPVGNYFTAPMGGGQMIPAGTVINNSTTIYIFAQVSSDSANCTDNLSFNISIAQPEVDELEDVTVCETYTLPGLVNGDYYTGADGTGTMLTAGDVITSSQTLYIFKRLNATCFNQSSFGITINPLPAIDSRSDIDICDQYVLTQLQHGNYYTGPNGTGTLLPAGSVITSSQRIYIFAISNTTPACTNENSFQVNIFSTTADSSANITACDAYTLPQLSADNNYYTLPGGPYGNGTQISAGTVITTSQTIYIYKESLIRTSFSCSDESSFTVTINQTPVIPAVLDVAACDSYTLRPLTVGNYFTGPNGTGTMLQAGDVVTTSQTMYIYAHTNTTPDCSSETSFDITIFNVDNVPNVTICHSYTLPALTIGNYFTGPNGTGTQLTAGATISATQTIYVYAVSPYLPRCADESSFTVTIIDTPVANATPVALRTICDEDGTNDGVTSFDLTSLNATILGTQTGNEFTIAYYETAADAANQVGAITSTTLTNLFVRVTNTLTDSCFDIKPITIIVNRLPEPSPVGGIICFDLDTQTLLNPYTMYSGLSSTTHTFVWANEAGETVGTNANYTAILPGTYTLVATSRATGCASEPVNVVVTPSEPAEITYTVDDEFQDMQSITVTATGEGDYEYQLDNGNFQDSPTFEDVTSGMHLITVRDKNGCGVATLPAVVINYPKYFTPNGDGYHDNWNIRDLRDQPSAVVTIYDRYGKVLTQIKPNGNGWDGTYNGNMMPSDDYWFSVTYTDENQVNQEFRAHFAMKR